MTSVKDDCVEIGRLARACDHEAAGVKELHDALWRAVWRHADTLGLTETDLHAIGGQDEAARGGGTGKTQPG